MNNAILILTYNNSYLTKKCVQENGRFLETNVFWCIVDNGSDVEQRNVLIGMANQFDWSIVSYNLNTKDFIPIQTNKGTHGCLILCKSNLGYSKGNNIGLFFLEKYIKPFSVLIANNDIFWNQDLFSILNQKLLQRKDLIFIGPQVLGTNGKIQSPKRKPGLNKSFYELFFPISFLLKLIFNRGKKPKSQIQIIDTEEYLSGSCFMANMQNFRRVGYFDPNTFLGCEETIVLEKGLKFGLKAAIVNDIYVIHLHSVTGKSVFGSIKYAQLLDKSCLYYLSTYKKYNKMQLSFYSLASNYFIFVWKPVLDFFKYILFNNQNSICLTSPSALLAKLVEIRKTKTMSFIKK